MQLALDSFQAALLRVRALHALHASLAKTLTAAIDLSDILRSAVVQTVSALDCYVHEITRLGMLECYAGSRQATDAFNKFPLPAGAIFSSEKSQTLGPMFEEQIRIKHGYLSFQKPEKIADAIRLFKSIKLWDEIGAKIGKDPKDIKITLSLTIDRRNKIAHEADIDPTYPGQIWPIDSDMVRNIIDFIEEIVTAMHDVCAPAD